MSKQLKFILSIFFILSLFFASFYIKDFRIDAPSDSLVSKNDKDFKYFSYYQDLFPTKNSLVLAIKSNDKIDKSLLTEIEKIRRIDETNFNCLFIISIHSITNRSQNFV